MKDTKLPPKPAIYDELQGMLSPTGAIADVYRVITRLFEVDVLDKTAYDDATVRMLLRIRLAPEGVIRAKDISKQMSLSTSHISRLVDRAESKGLLERRADPSDRRAHLLTLTELGVQELDAYIPHAVSLLNQAVFETLSSEEITTLIELLNRVEAVSKQMIAERE